MMRISKKAKDAVIMTAGVALALVVWAALYAWFWLVVREIPHETMRREAVVEAAASGAEQETAIAQDTDYNASCAMQYTDVDYILDVPLTVDYQIYLHGLCEEAGVPYTLAVAVIEQESHYNPEAVSPWGDYGLMQISHVCHAWLSEELGITDWFDPYQSARAGVYILGGYYRLYGADSGTLIAYNQGQAAAERLFAQGIYETDYSRRVMSIRWRLDMEGR